MAPSFDEGPFPGVISGPPPGDIPGWNEYDDDRGGARNFDDNWDDSDIKPTKKGNKKNQKDYNDSKKPVEIRYEGFILERAEPKAGERLSWSRVTKCKMHFEDKELIKIIKLHEKQDNRSPLQIFRLLSSKQQNVIDRAIEDKKSSETHKNAEWHLVDVQRLAPRSRGWSRPEIQKLQIILKRQPKTQIKDNEITKASKSTKVTKGGTSPLRDTGDVIDLSEPVNKKSNTKGNNKKLKKARSFDDFNDLDDPIGLGLRDGQFNNNNHNNLGRNNQQLPPDPFSQGINNIIPPPPPGMGPGPMPFDQNGGGHFAPPPPPPPPQGGGPNFNNPFQPNADIAAPGQYESPPMMHDHAFPEPGRRLSTRSLSRPGAPRRPSTTRRPSVDVYQFNEMRDEMRDQIEGLKQMMIDQGRGGSDSSEYTRHEEIFDPPDAPPRSYSPLSSPVSQFSDTFPPHGSLGRHKSLSREPRRNTVYPRSRNFQDYDYEPEYTHYGRSDRRMSQSRRHSSRPKLQHAVTYHVDDYPPGGAMEQPRFMPPAPRPPPRRLTYAPGYDYEDVDDRNPRDYRDMRDYGHRSDYDRRVPDFDRFERQPREQFRDRRQSYAGGGGGGYYH